jgi:RimJ/RimL family protein N-acetyltransferase
MSRVGDLPGADGAAPVPPLGRNLAGQTTRQQRPGVATMAPPDPQAGSGDRIAPDAATCGFGATPARLRSVLVAMAAHPATRRTPPWRALLAVAGHPVGVRLLEPTDGPDLTDVFRHLSPASRRQRFLSTGCEYPPDRVEALTSVSQPGRYALVATLLDRPRRSIIALAEFVTNPEASWVAEPAITFLDAYQGHRLGTRLSHMLIDAAQQRGVTRFTGTLDASNTAATRLVQRAGARLAIDTPGALRFALDLPPLN